MRSAAHSSICLPYGAWKMNYVCMPQENRGQTKDAVPEIRFFFFFLNEAENEDRVLLPGRRGGERERERKDCEQLAPVDGRQVVGGGIFSLCD